METRNQMYSAVEHQSITGYSPPTFDYSSVVLGRWQSVDRSKQQSGVFVPGIFRANAVKMEKRESACDWCNRTEPVTHSNRNLTVEGNLAAISLPTRWSYLSANYPWKSSSAGLSLQRAYASMLEADLDVGVMLGELRETLAGLANPLSAARTFIRQLRKGLRKRNTALLTLDMLGGSWLEWRYGIMPLIYSISDIIKHVNSQISAIDGKLFRKRGRSKYSGQYIERPQTTRGHIYYGSTWVEDYTEKYVTSIFYRVPQAPTWSESLGLQLQNIPSIVWELTTLSFVWDWFFSIGLWIKSLEPLMNRNFIGSSTSQKVEVQITNTLTKAKMYNVVPVPTGENVFRCTYSKLERRVNQALPLGPVITGESLSLKRQIDAISLLWGRFLT